MARCRVPVSHAELAADAAPECTLQELRPGGIRTIMQEVQVDSPPLETADDSAVITSDAPPKRRSLVPLLLVVGAALAVCAYFGVRMANPQLFADSSTYDIRWDPIPNWKPMPPAPLTLFVFKHPNHEIYVRGFQYQVDYEFNPTPELDTDGLAEYYLDTTRTKQPDWKGERLPDATEGPVRFSMIRRITKGKTVVTAFAAKGNTTIGVALFANGDSVREVESVLPELRKFLSTFTLNRATSRATAKQR